MKRLRRRHLRQAVTLGWLGLVAIPVMVLVSGGSVSPDQWVLRGLVLASVLIGIVLGIKRRR